MLACMLFAYLLSACSSKQVVYVQTSCRQVVKPQIVTVGDSMHWAALVERYYEACSNKQIIKEYK